MASKALSAAAPAALPAPSPPASYPLPPPAPASLLPLLSSPQILPRLQTPTPPHHCKTPTNTNTHPRLSTPHVLAASCPTPPHCQTPTNTPTPPLQPTKILTRLQQVRQRGAGAAGLVDPRPPPPAGPVGGEKDVAQRRERGQRALRVGRKGGKAVGGKNECEDPQALRLRACRGAELRETDPPRNLPHPPPPAPPRPSSPSPPSPPAPPSPSTPSLPSAPQHLPPPHPPPSLRTVVFSPLSAATREGCAGKPSRAGPTAGATTAAQGSRPWRACASASPRSSRGTATASPPVTEAPVRPTNMVSLAAAGAVSRASITSAVPFGRLREAEAEEGAGAGVRRG